MKNLKKHFGDLSEIKAEWNWILKYIIRYRLIIVLYIVLSLLGTVMSLGSSVSVKYLIDAVVSHLDNKIFKYAALVIGLNVLNFVFNAVSSWITANVGSKTSNEIRSEIYNHMLKANWQSIKKYHSGDLLNRIEGDVSTVSGGVITFIPVLLTNFLQFIGSLAIVLYYDKTMALLSLMSAPFLFFSSRFLIKKMRNYNKESRKLNGEVLSYSSESMQNIQVLKAFDLTKKYIDNFKDILENYRNVKLKYEKFSILMTFVLSMIGIIVSYSCYGWGVYRLWKGLISYGTMTLFLSLSGRLTSSFSALASMVPQAVTIGTAAGRIMEITDYETENDEEASKAKKMLKRTAKSGISIKADNLTFTYSDGDCPVLKNISFEVKPGETIAFIGPSGEGKSTLLKLLLGLVRPDSGTLTVCGDGENMAISDSTRRFCSYVPQEMGIFTGSVRDNLLLGNSDATDDDLFEAMKSAQIWDFVSSLPDGMDTQISEQAANISRGQAQRIAIARALLKKSRILLMDEATSALDIETESEVLSNIMITDPTKVCIITTHRESMLKYCTRIFKILPDGSMTQVNIDKQ